MWYDGGKIWALVRAWIRIELALPWSDKGNLRRERDRANRLLGAGHTPRDFAIWYRGTINDELRNNAREAVRLQHHLSRADPA